MGELVQKVTTDLSFHNGVLVPVGVPITIDTSKVQMKGPSEEYPQGNTPNLADMGEAPRNIPAVVAAIGPTGPDPIMPQQVPPGAYQTAEGYVVPGGTLLVGAAHPALQDDDLMEEERPVRRQAAEGTGDATVAATGPSPRDMIAGDGNGGLSDAERAELVELRRQRDAGGFVSTGAPNQTGTILGDAKATDATSTFDPAAVVDGTVPEVTARLDGLSRDQLLAVRDAEQDRDEATRSTLTAAIDAKLSALDAAHDDL